MVIKEIALHCTKGASDKVYFIQIVQSGNLYLVNFQYGRRGGTLKDDTKTQSPVILAQAQDIFDRLVREKKDKKGYVENNSLPRPLNVPVPSVAAAGAVATVTATAAAPAPVAPSSEFDVQLLNPVDESELEYFFKNPNICAQEKFDGDRRVLKLVGGNVYGLNRRGLPVPVTQNIADAALKLKTSGFAFDGEIVGDVIYLFDCVEFDGKDLTTAPYMSRMQYLSRALTEPQTAIVYAPIEATEHGKRALFERLKKEGKRGIVFKDLFAPYTAGRPNSGGTQVKFKFCAETTCRVAGVNSKRSVALEVRDASGNAVAVGNCTIPTNHQIPVVGDFVEIRYLYAYQGGSLYQPVYKGARNDKTEADLYDSLKFKGQSSDDE